MPDASRCPACGKPKPKWWDLCKECLGIYGSAASEWPVFVRLAVNDTERERYQEQQMAYHETLLGDAEPYDGMDPDRDEPLWTRPRDEMALSFASPGPMALPYAPYDDEEMNRQYRKSNGISPLPSEFVLA